MRLRFKFLAIFLLLPFVFVLIGCSGQGPKQGAGTLLGAASGAFIGSQFGGGKSQLFGVAIGALGGAYIGSEIGKIMDDNDRRLAEEAQRKAIETNTGYRWENRNNGNSGTVTPVKTYNTSNNRICREYEHDIRIGGKNEVMRGTACQRSDGSWEYQS